MIRFRAEPEGREPIVFLGLSDENLSRLRAGQPIRINAADEVGIGVEVVIYHGATEIEMARDLEKHKFLPPGAAEAVAEGMRTKRGWNPKMGEL